MVPLTAALAYIHQKFLVLTSAFQCALQITCVSVFGMYVYGQGNRTSTTLLGTPSGHDSASELLTGHSVGAEQRLVLQTLLQMG